MGRWFESGLRVPGQVAHYESVRRGAWEEEGGTGVNKGLGIRVGIWLGGSAIWRCRFAVSASEGDGRLGNAVPWVFQLR